MTYSICTNTTPLCYLPSGELVVYKHGEILILSQNNVSKRIRIFSDIRERLCGRFRYIHRLARLGIRASIAINENKILLSKGNHIYELDLTSGQLSNGFYCGVGIRPLCFTSVKGITTIDDGIYFGGYLGNSDRAPVNIYKYIGKDEWKVVYTFPQGSINHVHSIVSDTYRDCLWILTGDFDEAAAIWRVTDNFQECERVCFNNQKYRACVAFAVPEGLLYATDTPFSDNYIYVLNPDTYQLNVIQDIKGSCIYGCQWKDKYVFSSTVEGDGRSTSRLEFYFGRRRGVGIKDSYVHLYIGNLTNGFEDVYKEKKDFLPYYTFQFGVFKFPYGNNNSNRLYFQPIATNNDLKLMMIDDNRRNL